jgi:hypothetical protein
LSAVVLVFPISRHLGLAAVVAEIINGPPAERGQRLDRRCRYFRERAVELGVPKAIAVAMSEDLAVALRKRLTARVV